MTDKALTVFGSRDQVREIQMRLVSMMLPGGKKLSEPETKALAQLAVAHGLDPFNGEIWMIPGSGPMIGIKGLRKKAREQISNGKDGNFWCNFREINNPEERAHLMIPDFALAFECKLMDSETINNYVSTIKALKDAGMPWEAIEQIVGAQPYTSGYGYFQKGEHSRMTPVQCAMKRSEADAIKRRFDVPFGIASEGDPGAQDYEGAWQEVTNTTTKLSTEEAKAQRQSDNSALFGTPEFDEEIRNAPEIPLNTPKPAARATSDKVKPAAIKTQLWHAMGDTIAQRFPQYAKKDGSTDFYHLSMTAGKLGYAEVTSENIEQVQVAIEKHAQEKAA